MKATSYYILAGILLIVAAFLRVILPASLYHFKNLSLSPSALFNGLFGIVVLCVVIGFFSSAKKPTRAKSKHQIFDNPQSETISMAYISLKWRCIKVNKLCCELLGYSARELLKMDFQRLIHPDDFKNDLLSIQKIIAGEQTTHQSQQRYLDKNGDLVFLSVTISLARDKERKPLYFICQFQKPHTLIPLDTITDKTAYSTTA
jgi:PAS domain S-box-containing protein